MRPTSASTENLSEISESGTGRTESTSERSAYSEHRDEFLSILGLTEEDEIFTDRFRVDRKKLEDMIMSDNESLDSTKAFFQGIMDASSTHISWPLKLKIGAKSKKDPHIWVTGRNPQDVKTAKDTILSALGIQNNQVTMKLSVSYTHHSHIIGEGGQTITKVRKQTGCHIHFPDSNRNGSETKSNQVSITGCVEGVEKARTRVRELVPLIFCFELPVLGSLQTFPDMSSPYIQQISQKYNVHVSCRTRSRLHATLAVVKGCEWEVESVKQATLLLINHMCGKVASQVPVQMTMEISPHHHPIVLGPQSQYLKAIMENTQTQIMFPDAQDPNIPVLKRSNVTITGQINNVYLARQQLTGSLPINLTFSLMEENPAINSERINQISEALDVSISTRHCPKQNNLSVIIKGVERNTSNIYEARRILLNLDEKVEANIPDSFMIPNPPKILDRYEMNDINSTRALPYILTPDDGPSFPQVSLQEHSPLLVPSLYNPVGWGSQMPPGLMSIAWGPMMLSQQQQQQQQQSQQQPPHVMVSRPRPTSVASRDISVNSSGYGSQLSFNQFSNMSTSPISEMNGLSAVPSFSNSSASSLSIPGVNPRNQSPTMQGMNHQLSLDLSNMMKGSSDWSDQRNLSFDSTPGQAHTPIDYEQKKFLAVKALQNMPNSNEVRVPTSAWSGYGFSLTDSMSLFREQPEYLNSQKTLFDSDPWMNSPEMSPFSNSTDRDQCNSFISNSNTLESVPSGMLKRIQNCDMDLPTLLASLGLEKYIQLFKSQEIDMSSFLMFNDVNLKEIGVTAYGARHKMMLAIAELKNRQSSLISAAPGAERKRFHGWPKPEQ